VSSTVAKASRYRAAVLGDNWARPYTVGNAPAQVDALESWKRRGMGPDAAM
jgi:hypothetical protein